MILYHTVNWEIFLLKFTLESCKPMKIHLTKYFLQWFIIKRMYFHKRGWAYKKLPNKIFCDLQYYVHSNRMVLNTPTVHVFQVSGYPCFPWDHSIKQPYTFRQYLRLILHLRAVLIHCFLPRILKRSHTHTHARTHTVARNTMTQENFLKSISISGQHGLCIKTYWLQAPMNKVVFKAQQILCCSNVKKNSAH